MCPLPHLIYILAQRLFLPTRVDGSSYFSFWRTRGTPWDCVAQAQRGKELFCTSRDCSHLPVSQVITVSLLWTGKTKSFIQYLLMLATNQNKLENFWNRSVSEPLHQKCDWLHKVWIHAFRTSQVAPISCQVRASGPYHTGVLLLCLRTCTHYFVLERLAVVVNLWYTCCSGVSVSTESSLD